MINKLLTLIFIVLIENSYAIDINDIDVGDGYYAVLGAGQSEYSYALESNKHFGDLTSLKAKAIKDNLYQVVIVRINKSNNTLKIRLTDNSVDWSNVKYIFTKSEMQNLKDLLYSAIRNRDAESRKYCCCHTSMTNFWDMEFQKKIWAKTENCNNGWKSYTEIGGGQTIHPGTCTEYSSHNSSGSCR